MKYNKKCFKERMEKLVFQDLILIPVIFLLIAESGFLSAPCKAEQSTQTNNQKFVFQDNLSQRPDYVIALEKGDYKSAIKEMRSLAEKGDPCVQYNLGLLYFRGSAGLPQNYKEAEKLWRKSAEQGLVAAASGLATIYQTGKDINFQESFEWYRKAAKRNLIIAQFFLGCFYERGNGVAKDYKEAAKWYRKAADQDNVFAQFNLGNMYENGRGVPQDYQEACRLYRKVAVKGGANAQILLGTMYLKGTGVTKDYVQAYKWFYIASPTSDKRLAGIAKKAIELTSTQLNRQQIAEAIRLAKEEKITKIETFEM